ncbi:MAG TPA: alpha/beta fold hydrolase [Acidimicrobiales bacterium]|nr:alpha/beta fold hydrolase [Acidimicrobiales bacterium]
MPTDIPVLFVHGFTSSFDRGWRQAGWPDLVADSGRPVLGVDLLGHGDAPKPHDPAAYAEIGAGVLAAMEDHEVVDGVGFSAGAGVLLDLAVDYPTRFRRLALLGMGAGYFRTDVPEPLALALEGKTEVVDHPMAQAFVRFANSPGQDPLALAAFLRRPLPDRSPERLAAVKCPVLIVLGDRDGNGPAEPLADALPNAEVTVKVLRGVDHLGTPGDFGCVDATLSFLEDGA